MTHLGEDIRVAAKSAFATMVALIFGVVVPLTLGAVLGLGSAGPVTMSLTDQAPQPKPSDVSTYGVHTPITSPIPTDHQHR